MSEKHLLLPSAKTAVLVVGKEPARWFRKLAVMLGVCAVIIGGADAAARISKDVFGEQASFMAFAPAALLADPSLGGAAVPATSTTTFPLVPARISVPALGISAAVESVGKKSDGSMATPSTFYTVGWYSLGAKPGEQGNAVFAGHVNNALTTAGVFEHLDQISLGDSIMVSDAQGNTQKYIVSQINDYDRTAAPLNEIFALSGPSQVVLVTCDGDWDPKAHSYDKRLVVVARLAAL
jgi:LPXTG-site transpeptidase (sortase) family protein